MNNHASPSRSYRFAKSMCLALEGSNDVWESIGRDQSVFEQEETELTEEEMEERSPMSLFPPVDSFE